MVLFLDTLHIRCRTIEGIQKEATILTTTHIGFRVWLQTLAHKVTFIEGTVEEPLPVVPP